MTPPTVRSREPHSPPEKAATATRWQAEPSIPTQVTTPGTKPQPWGNNPCPPASLCSRTPWDTHQPRISAWRTTHGTESPPIKEQILWAFGKPGFSFFTPIQEEEQPGSHPRMWTLSISSWG